MKIYVFLFFFMPIFCLAQSTKFEIEPQLILSHHFSNRSPIGNTSIGVVKPSYAISLRDFGLKFTIHKNNKSSYGLHFFNQEFEYGYRPKNLNANTGTGLSFTTGMTWARYYKKIIQWNVMPFYARKINLKKIKK